MIVIVGLGNPEKQYDNTYHNIGFKSVDYFASVNDIEFTKNKFDAMYGEGNIDGQKVVVLKPTTYMNRSGLCVSQVVNMLKLPLDKLLVVYDDIDLNCGTLRFRKQGSAGTHNGMRSIVQYLGSQNFARLRVGIGRDERMGLADYVVSKINSENMEKINNALPKINSAIKTFVASEGKIENIDFNTL